METVCPPTPIPGARDPAVADEASCHKDRGVDPNGEADSLRRQNDGGVDTDYAASRIDQWAA